MRRGRIYDPNRLWQIERQVDAAEQHVRLALNLVRQELARTNKPGPKKVRC